MKKSIAIIVFALWPCICFPQELIQLSYLGDKVFETEEDIMSKGTSCIAAFYKSINFAITTNQIKVRFFNNYQDFKEYQRMHNEDVSNTGYYSAKGGEVVIFKGNLFIETFFHESNHYLLRSHFKNVPNWINEGLSEYFRYVTPKCSIRNISSKSKKIVRIKGWIEDKIDDDLEQIVSLSREQWKSQSHNDPDNKLYTISWAAVYFLMSQRNGDQLMGEILHKLMARSTSKEAIDLTYPGGFQKFKSDFVLFYKEWR